MQNRHNSQAYWRIGHAEGRIVSGRWSLGAGERNQKTEGRRPNRGSLFGRAGRGVYRIAYCVRAKSLKRKAKNHSVKFKSNWLNGEWVNWAAGGV